MQVEDSNGNLVDSQTSLLWNRDQRADTKKYEVNFCREAASYFTIFQVESKSCDVSPSISGHCAPGNCGGGT